MSESHPRATLTDADGTTRDVSDRLSGGDDFYRSWQSNVETPHRLSSGGWQGPDDNHPQGTGKPAYRVAYRTLRTVPFPELELSYPNLRLLFANGDVSRGGIRFQDVIPGRRDGESVIPEAGRLLRSADGKSARYVPCVNMNVSVSGWEEVVQAVSFVEIIWICGDQTERDPAALLEQGRNAIASLLTILEFEFGPRLLSSRLLEEVGETFDDWHWSRQISTGTVYAESQASMVHVDGREFVARVKPLLDHDQALPEADRARLILACRWYWSAQEQADPVLAFIQWWLVVECLAMVDTTNIRPVRKRVAALLNCTESKVGTKLGRLFGLRSLLLHGKQRAVSDDDLDAVQTVARLLLASTVAGSTAREMDAARRLFGVEEISDALCD